jgi:hypothetical protein
VHVFVICGGFEEIIVERDRIRAELILLRKYVIHHGIGIGECCAWERLKKEFDVGQTTPEDDERWLAHYHARQAINAEARRLERDRVCDEASA